MICSSQTTMFYGLPRIQHYRDHKDHRSEDRVLPANSYAQVLSSVLLGVSWGCSSASPAHKIY
jgi:hypothetical protein